MVAGSRLKSGRCASSGAENDLRSKSHCSPKRPGGPLTGAYPETWGLVLGYELGTGKDIMSFATCTASSVDGICTGDVWVDCTGLLRSTRVGGLKPGGDRGLPNAGPALRRALAIGFVKTWCELLRSPRGEAKAGHMQKPLAIKGQSE